MTMWGDKQVLNKMNAEQVELRETSRPSPAIIGSVIAFILIFN